MNNTINDGGPAHPVTYDLLSPGMSLRDYFAAKALPAIYEEVSREWVERGCPVDWRQGISMDCYSLADAMIEARKVKT